MDSQPQLSYSNGSFPISNAEAGPSSLLPRQSDSANDPSKYSIKYDDSSSSSKSNQKLQPHEIPKKKKKATRACFHCQKAHLTCDDARPCQRCIKRGCADTCVEGHRKKAKYLLDEEELELLKAQKSRRSSTHDALSPTFPSAENDAYVPSMLAPTGNAFQSNLDTAAYSFGSEGANLEYSMISHLLSSSADPTTSQTSRLDTGNTNGFGAPWIQGQPDGNARHDSQLFSATSDPSISPDQYRYHSRNSSSQQQQFPFPSPLVPTGQPPSGPPFLRANSSGSQPYSASPISIEQSPQTAADGIAYQSPLTAVPPISNQPRPPMVDYMPPFTSDNDTSHDSMDLDYSADVYSRITAPYDYTAGYHYLMRYLQNGTFDKNDILRVVRALAIFRPSLIALQMPLSDEDEVFVEKCFQRSLLELDKLIKWSGTPTVVWRRTGEICLVGLEFSLLTEWPRHELLGGKRFIYELFETQSTVEYWENFANHAFENTTQSVHSHCVLIKPSGQHIPCTFCFSIRRDLFDLPYVVIGQWLPML